MSSKGPARPPPKVPAPPRARLKARGRNRKLADQTRKRLGKHYASRYQTMRRG